MIGDTEAVGICGSGLIDAIACALNAGLFVTQVCKYNGLAYYHGERTVTYTACVLF